VSDDNFVAEEDLAHSGKPSFLRRQLPYISVLILALVGVAYTNASSDPIAGYWELVAVVIAGLCVYNAWGKRDDRPARVRLIWTQSLHWIAVLVAMNIMLLGGVQQTLPTLATSLVLLMLLALGSFLAGLNLASLQLGFLGLVLAFSVPAISWLKQSMLLIILVAVFAIGVGMTIWSSRRER
jgi:hypothetical protein